MMKKGHVDGTLVMRDSRDLDRTIPSPLQWQYCITGQLRSLYSCNTSNLVTGTQASIEMVGA